MIFPLGCIVSRDGSPNLDTYRRVDAACRRAGGTVAVVTDPYSVASGRNRAVADLLKGPWSHLWFVDDDVAVQEDCLSVLLGMGKEIAAGCYPSIKTSVGDVKVTVPYITQKGVDGDWIRQWYEGERELSAAGTGCLLIEKSVFASVGFPWFVWREEWDGRDLTRTSDDIDFCQRATAKGHRIFGHGNVRCGHRKTVDVGVMMTAEGERISPITWTGPKTLDQQTAWPGYGSHVPALVSVARATPIRTVVEFGSGIFSTQAFLNREWFPDLVHLISHESELPWYQEMSRRFQDDRWNFVMQSLDQMVKNVSIADLVLIDCDAETETGEHDFSARLKLIEWYQSLPGIVVVHDANFHQIAPALQESRFKYKTTYVPESGPWTAVMSNDYDVTKIQWVDLPRPLSWR